MISRFAAAAVYSQITDGSPLADCQSPDHRQEQCQALVADMARLLCGRAAALGFLVAKGSDTALVMGVAGNRRRPSLTMELTQGHQRRAYLLFSDPLLGVVDDDGLPACTREHRSGRDQLHIHQLQARRSDLIEMRRLLAKKLTH